MFIVSVDIFSGVENPKWALTREEANYFVNLLANERALGSDAWRSLVGYRGFIVKGTSPIERQVTGGSPLRAFDSPRVERFLLETSKERLNRALRDVVAASIRGLEDVISQLERFINRDCPNCLARRAPNYLDNFWNKSPAISKNNCYNYATDILTNTFAQPGLISGIVTGLTAGAVLSSATADGLVAVPNFNQVLTNGHFVALVVWDHNDFHWYRQDRQGCWSHKPGTTAVLGTDNKGNRITDPSACDLGPYRFIGYMEVGPGVLIV